jgi:hypothetical protein
MFSQTVRRLAQEMSLKKNVRTNSHKTPGIETIYDHSMQADT